MNRVLDGLSSLNTQYDILVMGESGVGKTSLVHRYVYGTFSEGPHDQAEQLYIKALDNENAETIGSASSRNSSLNEISILDSSPLADTYGASRKQQIKNASSILFVYAMDDKKSFEALEYLIDTARTLCDGELPPFLIVASKLDRFDDYQVSWEEGEALADQLDAIGFYVVSALADSNVGECFAPLVEAALEMKSNRGRFEEHTLLEALANSPTSSMREVMLENNYKFRRPMKIPDISGNDDGKLLDPNTLPAIESFSSDFPQHPEACSETTPIPSPGEQAKNSKNKSSQSTSSISTGSQITRLKSYKKENAQKKEKSACCVIA